MTIKTLPVLPGSLPAPKPIGTRAAASPDRFAETLASAVLGRETAVNPDQYLIVVELARLQMMQGVFSLDSDQGESSPWTGGLPSLAGYGGRGPAGFVGQKTDALPGPVTQPLVQPQPPPVRAAAAQQAIPGPVRVPETMESIVDRASRRYGVDPALIKAVIKAESSFNQHAVSPVGAQGLMQLMPGTASDLGVKNPLDAEENVMGGTKYLKGLLKKYDGHLDKALAAYNWGPGNVDRRGIETLPRETRDYLVKVKRFYDNYSA